MIEVILDVSANTFRNDSDYFKRMVKEIKNIDSGKYSIIFKTQLFSQNSEAAKINICLQHRIFEAMWFICNEAGYKLTSSVFDLESLQFLLQFNIPFIKIACRPELYWLLGEIPRKIPVYISRDLRKPHPLQYYANEEVLDCIPEYPAKIKEYKKIFERRMHLYFSDHTKGIELFKLFINRHNSMQLEAKNLKSIFEMHYVLERNETNPDSGPFAKTIDELKEIL